MSIYIHTLSYVVDDLGQVLFAKHRTGLWDTEDVKEVLAEPVCVCVGVWVCMCVSEWIGGCVCLCGWLGLLVICCPSLRHSCV
jgi:hypothetical protein